MLHPLAVLLATFWAWATVRYIAEPLVPRGFAVTRPAHPLVVAALPLYLYWPDWVLALAVAGGVGLLTAVVDRFLIPPSAPTVLPRRRRGGLPSLPRP